MLLTRPFLSTSTTRLRTRILLIAFLLAELLLIVNSEVRVIKAAPPYEYSYYVQFNDTNKAYNLGCGQGTTDKNSGQYRNSVMILDFGQATYSGSEYGTNEIGASFISLNSIKWHAIQVARGYSACLANANSSQLTLIVGTTNNFGTLNYNHGYAFGQMIVQSENQISGEGVTAHANIFGGSDIETGWGSVNDTESWLNGYTAGASGRAFYDYGDAASCPQSGTTSNPTNCWAAGGTNTWNQEAIWYVSWKGLNYSIPEQYNTVGAQASQWQQLSLYSYLAHGGRMDIQGSLTQQIACSQVGGCAGTNNPINTGWQQLYNALNSDPQQRTAQGLTWATDVQYAS